LINKEKILGIYPNHPTEMQRQILHS